MNWKDIKNLIRKELKEANLTEKGKHPGCDCPGSPPNVPPFYKTWAQCTAGSGGVTSCAGCCQGGTRTPDTPEDGREVAPMPPVKNLNLRSTDKIKRKNKKKTDPKLKEATLTANDTKFNIRTGVNKNPTKVGIKIQLEPLSGYLEPNVKDQLEVAIQEKLNTELSDYDIQVSKDTDVPREHVIGFFIPLSQLKNLIVKSLTGKSEAASIQAPEPEGEELNEGILNEMRIRELNEISKTVLKEDFYAFINAGNNMLRSMEDQGMGNGKKYLGYLVKHNIM